MITKPSHGGGVSSQLLQPAACSDDSAVPGETTSSDDLQPLFVYDVDRHRTADSGGYYDGTTPSAAELLYPQLPHVSQYQQHEGLSWAIN